MPASEIWLRWQGALRAKWHKMIKTYWGRLVLGAGSGIVVALLLFKVHLLGDDPLEFDAFRLETLVIVAFAYLGGRSALGGYNAITNAKSAASAATCAHPRLLQFSLARLIVGTALIAAILGIYGAQRVPEGIAIFWAGLALLSTLFPRIERISGAACALFASLALVHALPQPYNWPLSVFGPDVAPLAFEILYLACLAVPVILLRLFGGLYAWELLVGAAIWGLLPVSAVLAPKLVPGGIPPSLQIEMIFPWLATTLAVELLARLHAPKRE